MEIINLYHIHLILLLKISLLYATPDHTFYKLIKTEKVFSSNKPQ